MLVLLLQIFSTGFLLVSFFLPLLQKPLKPSSHSHVHGPPSYPIIGCLISFYRNRTRLLDWYTDLLSHSPVQTIVVDRFGARRTVVTANPANVEYILKTRFQNFPKGKPFTELLGDFLGGGIFNSDGDLWRTQRKLASHEFSTNSVRECVMRALEEAVGKRLIPLLESIAVSKEIVDLQELLKRLAFDIVCQVSLGTGSDSGSGFGLLDLSADPPPLLKAFDGASEITAKRAAAPIFAVWKLKRALNIGSERQLKKWVAVVQSSVTDIIQEKRKKFLEVSKRGDCSESNLLWRLLAAGQEEEEVRDMMISFIMAGRDTTSAAMTWLFWLLSCNLNVKEELLREINSVSDGLRPLNYEVLKKMDFLKACLYESMRLYPPVAWDSKHAEHDDVLPDGTRVWNGDRVTYFPYGMGRMEGLWGKDRFEFKPERWFVGPDRGEEGLLKSVSPYAFPVFQAGPRVCLGKEMSFVQMKYVVSSVLRRFEIVPVGSDPPVFVPLLTAHMAGGLNVMVRRRSDL